MPNPKKTPVRQIRCKVVMIGDSGVGKTSILLRHDGQGFTSCMSTTLSASFLSAKTRTSHGEVVLNLWDTAGQERFRSMLPMYVRNAVAAVFVYDITRYDSFKNLEYWFEELARQNQNKMFKYVLANKSDLQNKRVISEDEGREYAASKEAMYFETSALNGRGIEKAIQAIADQLVEYNLSSSTDDKQFSLNNSIEYVVDENSEKNKNSKRFCCTIT